MRRPLMRLVLTACAMFTLGTSGFAGDGELPQPDQVLSSPIDSSANFGKSVDASDSYMIVGAPESNGSAGGFAIYRWEEPEWILDYVSISDWYDPGEEAGAGVAISDNGVAMVGVPGRDKGVLEAWYKDENLGWSHATTIAGSKDLPVDARFGAAIDIHGSHAVVGAPTGNGRVFVFEEVKDSGGQWWPIFNEGPTGGTGNSNLGHDVAIFNDRIYASAPNHYGGAVFFYQLIDGAVNFVDMPSLDLPWQAGAIGSSIAVNNEVLMIGSPQMPVVDSIGAVWGLMYDPNSVEKQTHFLMFYIGSPAGKGDVGFGDAVAIYGENIVVGAPGHNGGAGLIEAYRYTWNENPDNPDGPPTGASIEETGLAWGEAGDAMGASLAMHYNGVAVGAPSSVDGSGEVNYFFNFDGDGETAISNPVPTTAATLIDLNDAEVQPHAIDLFGDFAVVGFPDANNSAGSATVMQRSGGMWTPIGELSGSIGDHMGFAVAITDGRIAVGSPNANGMQGQVHTWNIAEDLSLTNPQTLEPFSHLHAHSGYDIDLFTVEAMEGDVHYLIVGAPGIDINTGGVLTYGAYAIYKQYPSQNEWTLVHSAQQPFAGQHATGTAVAVGPADGTVVAYVGAPLYDWDDSMAADTGVVRVLAENIGWDHMDDFPSSMPPTSDWGGQFGTAIDARYNDVIIGQPGGTDSYPAGAAMLIEDVTSGGTIHMLAPTASWPSNWGFGRSVAISHDGKDHWACVGAPGFQSFRGPDTGSVEVYLRGYDGNYLLHTRVQAMGLEDINDLGGRVAISDNTLMFTNDSSGNHAPPAALATTELARTVNWKADTGGTFTDPNNWTVPPQPNCTYVFSLLEADPYPVFLRNTSQLRVGHIQVAFDSPILVLDEDGDSAIVEHLSLQLGSNPSVRAGSMMVDWGTLKLIGDTDIGNVDAGEAGRLGISKLGRLTTQGTFSLASNSGLEMALGYETESGHIYTVTESVNLSGSLRVWIEPEATTTVQVGDRFVVIDSATTPSEGNDRFGAAILPALPDDKAFALTYGPAPGTSDGSWQAAVEVVSLSGLLGFGDPNSLTVSGTPIAMEIVDLNNDGADEICVVFDGEPGQLIVFENDGSGGVGQQLVQNTLHFPTSLAMGDFDNDGNTDLAVGHASGWVRGFYNDTGNLSDGFSVQDLSTIGPVMCLIQANIDGTDGIDLIAGIDDTDGDGFGSFQYWVGTSQLLGGGLGGGGNGDSPSGVPVFGDPSEDEGQKGTLAAFGTSTGNAMRLKGTDVPGIAGSGLSFDVYPAGGGISGIALKDVTGDGFVDIAVTSGANDSIALLRSNSDGSDFMPSMQIPVGTNPQDIEAIDVDDDGDIDLATITVDSEGNPIVRVLVNEGGLNFTSMDLSSGDSPKLIGMGDIDGDGIRQLVTIGGGSSDSLVGGNGQLVMREVDEPAPCPGDTDGNGIVNIDDLLTVIGQFGKDCNGGCNGDTNDDGVVNIDDVLQVISAFGPC